jgi:hypothetical protein
MTAPVVEEFRLLRETLVGFACIRFASGIIIADIAIHLAGRDHRAWASQPARPMLDGNGVALRGPVCRLITFATAEIRNRWLAAAIAAVRAKYSAAFAVDQP